MTGGPSWADAAREAEASGHVLAARVAPQANRENVQTVEQILAEFARRGLPARGRGGGGTTRIDFARLELPTGRTRLLKHAQQLSSADPTGTRHLVEKIVLVGQGEAPVAAFGRAGESALLVAEKSLP